MNNSSYNQVVLTQTGEIFNPIALDDTKLIIAHFVCCFIGIPFNVSIAVAIIRHRRLRKKPRNIFLLGIILSNLSFFTPAITKLIYWSFYPIESVCQVYVAFVGVPQGLLSLNMLLALVDRYLAINYPLLHREKMTVRFASIIVILSSTLLVFLLKFVYIVCLVPLRCEVGLVHAKVILIILSVLFALCLAFNFVVHRQTKNLLGEFRVICPPTGQRISHQIEFIELATFRNDSTNERMSSTITIDYSCLSVRPMSIHVNRKKLNQIDIEATRSLISGLASLIITTLPPVIFVASFLICRLISQSECSHLNWLAPYMIELGLINLICGPLIFLIRNKELRTAIVNLM